MVELDDLIQHTRELRPLPATAVRLAGMVQSPMLDLTDVSEVVAFDQALTMRLLKAANSAALGGTERFTVASEAVFRLGVARVLSIAVAGSVREPLQRDVAAYGLADGELWSHSVATAAAAEVLCEAAGVDLPPETFTAALLHDIGKGLPGDHAALGSEMARTFAHRLHLDSEGIEILGWLVRDHLSMAEVATRRDLSEPATIERDKAVAALLQSRGVEVRAIKDQTIFERAEVMKDDGTPYTVFTPYKKCWLRTFNAEQAQPRSLNPGAVAPLFAKGRHSMPTMEAIGFRRSEIVVPPFDPSIIRDYAETRNTPSISTTRIGPHLRFGTVSIRRVIQGLGSEDVYLSELIWREFFMQILFHFPQVVTTSFKPQYDRIPWRNDASEFEAWFLSAAHTRKDVDGTIAAAREVMLEIAK